MVETVSSSRNSKRDHTDMHSTFGTHESHKAGRFCALKEHGEYLIIKTLIFEYLVDFIVLIEILCFLEISNYYLFTIKICFHFLQEVPMVFGMINLECQFHWPSRLTKHLPECVCQDI